MTTDDASRRAYWAEQLEKAANFMEAILEYPVAECGEPVENLPQAAKSAGVPMQFSTTKIASHDRLFYLRTGIVQAALRAAEKMSRRGWTLRIEDGYRNRIMQTDLGGGKNLEIVLQRTIWELGGKKPSPELLLRRLQALVATKPKIGTHMSASALDISVVNNSTGVEVDRGAPYLELSVLTPMDSPFISKEARENRRQITEIMESEGFATYPWEFWHYSQGDAYDQLLHKTGKPGRYGAVNVDLMSCEVTAIANPGQCLHPVERIQAFIDENTGD